MLDTAQIMEYLRSGKSLSSIDEDLVQQEMSGISKLEANISRLERDIAGLNAQLAHLKTQHAKEASRGKLLGALHAPVRRLFPEVLSEIFVCCLPQLHQDTTSFPTPSRAPLLLGQVCSLWRRISTDAPVLWKDLSFLWTEKDPQRIMPLAALWLSRSLNLPLKISLPEKIKLPEKLSPLLLSHSHRFEAVRIYSTHLLEVFNYYDSILWPGLKDIRITCTDDTLSTDHPIDLRLATPNLQSAQFDVLSNARSQTFRICNIVTLCWDRLSSLTLYSTAMDILHILPQCPNLRNLVLLKNGAILELEKLHPDPIVLPKLYSLYSGLSCLHYLVLPNLQSYGCVYRSGLHGWPKTEFLSLVSRSQCCIRDFSIESYRDIPEKQQVEIIQSLPHLRTFTVFLGRFHERSISPRAALLLASRNEWSAESSSGITTHD